MLLSFRFANHRSFRDEQQLNLLPVYGTDGVADSAGSLEAVPVVGIFGANASGKSNLISAIDYVCGMVGTSDRRSEPGLGPARQPFRLDPEVAKAPSSYAVDLMIGGVRHTYGFTVDDDRIVEEWLYSYPVRRKRVVFERTAQHFDWGEESTRSSVKRLTDIVAPTALFLSVAARFEPRGPTGEGTDSTTASLHGVYSWLWHRTYAASLSGESVPNQNAYYASLLSDGDERAAVVDLLRSADVGLRDILVKPPSDDYLLPERKGIRWLYGHPEDEGQVRFLHTGSTGNVTLDITEESSGTLRFLELASWTISVFNNGGLIVADEIDKSLHPLLTATLIRLFGSRSVNRARAQLVFTTHDATLLGSIDGEDVLGRDEVWFTSKREDGSSELFPLTEFKPRRQGENRLKRYLNGSYGAIPELSMRLFEQAVMSRMDGRAE